jgi:hypothetical protein
MDLVLPMISNYKRGRGGGSMPLPADSCCPVNPKAFAQHNGVTMLAALSKPNTVLKQIKGFMRHHGLILKSQVVLRVEAAELVQGTYGTICVQHSQQILLILSCSNNCSTTIGCRRYKNWQGSGFGPIRSV